MSRWRAASHPLAKRQRQLQDFHIDLLLDVGANAGQYVRNIRDLGYTGRIVSFEPLSAAFELLRENADRDPAWDIRNFALGSAEEKLEIHIAENSWSSSLLNVNDNHVSAMPSARSVGSETIEVKTLDSAYEGIDQGEQNILLKIDTQGYEKRVLEGGLKTLERVKLMQLEMSFVPLYDGQPLFAEMYDWICEHGFQLATLEEGWWDPNTGTLMQIDGVFQRVPSR